MPCELIDSSQGLAALGAEWEELERRCAARLFQSHRFLTSWYACAGVQSGARPAVVVYREEGVLRAVFPGCIVTKFGVRILTWLGGFFIVDYGDVLLDPASSLAVDAFLDEALRLVREATRYHVGYFHNLRHDAVAYPYLRARFREFRSEAAPFVELAGDFEQYLDSLKRFRKKQKSDTLRQIKRLSELGELEFRITQPGEAEADRLLEAFFAQKRWRFEVSGVHGVLFKSGYEEFYREQARVNPAVQLCCLTLNGAVIATHFGYLFNNRLYFLMPTYDNAFGKYSPGRVLTYYLIRECFRQGVEVFDFCIGDEDYKYEWTDRDVPVTSFVSDDLGGTLIAAAKKGKNGAVDFLNRLKGVKR